MRLNRTSDNFKKSTLPAISEGENADPNENSTSNFDINTTDLDRTETPTSGRKRKADYEGQMLETVKQLCNIADDDQYDFYGKFLHLNKFAKDFFFYFSKVCCRSLA